MEEGVSAVDGRDGGQRRNDLTDRGVEGKD